MYKLYCSYLVIIFKINTVTCYLWSLAMHQENALYFHTAPIC